MPRAHGVRRPARVDLGLDLDLACHRPRHLHLTAPRAVPPTLPEGPLIANGRVRVGPLRLPLRTPNFERVDLTGLGPCVPLLRARQRFWFGFALTHPEVHLATIAIDLGPAVVSAFYVYERTRRAFHEHTALALAGRHACVAMQPWDAVTHVDTRRHHVRYHHLLDRNQHTITLDVGATKTAPEVRAELVMHEDPTASPPLVMSVPTAGRWFMYTHKAHAPASGFLIVDGRTYTLDPARDLLSLDEHKAAYPYRQDWTWASFAGRLPGGRLIAANLCTNRHYIDPEHANENRLWVGDRMDTLGAIVFDVPRAASPGRWHMTDTRAQVDLAFTPDGQKSSRVGLGPYRLDYFQAFGHFRGTLVGADGERHDVADLYGVAEVGHGRN